MITFSQLGVYGRLGNQLFQYALLKAVSLKTNKQIILDPEINNKVWHGQKCLLNNFHLTSVKYEKIICDNTYEEKKWMEYDENVFKIKNKTDFHGFFQNINYFYPYRNEIRQEFKIIDQVENKIKNYLSKYSNTRVSLHVRRGDCSDGTNPELAKVANDFSCGSLQFNYYSKALQIIPSDSTVLLFTGGSRNNNDNDKDLEWCSKTFNDKRIKIVNDLNDIESFCCMKNCDINILSFASTFSLWTAYLNKNNKCIAPSHFYPHVKINLNDLFYPEWEVI